MFKLRPNILILFISKCFYCISNRIMNYINKAPVDAEEKIRIQQYTVFLALGVPTMILYCVYNIIQNHYILATFVLFSCFSILLGWYLLCKLKSGIVIYRFNGFIFGILILYLLMIGGEDGSKILWMYVFPLISFLLFGKNEGVFWNVGHLSVALLLLFKPMTYLPIYPYHPQFVIRFVITYLMVSSIVYWFEYLRHTYHKGMTLEHQKLKNEEKRLIKVLKEQQKVEREKELLIQQLQEALDEVKTLSGLIAICSHCHKIRDDEGFWRQMESYIQKHSDAKFSHGLCPDCVKNYYSEFNDEKNRS